MAKILSLTSAISRESLEQTFSSKVGGGGKGGVWGDPGAADGWAGGGGGVSGETLPPTVGDFRSGVNGEMLPRIPGDEPVSETTLFL